MITTRQLTEDDYEAVVALQRDCFPGMKPVPRAQFNSQIKHFPEGQFGIEIDGQLAASSSSLMVDFGDYEAWHNWAEVSDNGWIRNHDPEGDTLYGIEIQVSPKFRGRKLARRLYDARKQLCRVRNVERIVIGGRIPGYVDHADEMTAKEYVDAVLSHRLYDQVLTAQVSNGFDVLDVVADYLPEDEDSAGYATILEWVNVDHVPERKKRHRRPVFPVRVALVQYPMRRVDSFEHFASQVEYYVDTASDYRSDFLLFPELISVQLLSIIPHDRPSIQARALAGYSERYREMFRNLAMKYAINIIGGSTFELDDDGNLYNVAWLFRRDGTYEGQKKLHITPAEAKWWGVTGGDKVEVFDTDRGRIAILICYDVEFPEACRIASAKGARLMFVPFNTNDRQGYQRVRTCAHARCIENHQYVVMAGCCGHLPNVQNADLHYAQSAVLTPCDVAFPALGVAAETAATIEELIVQDLDLEMLRRHRTQGTVRNWDDRRTDLYQVTWKDDRSV